MKETGKSLERLVASLEKLWWIMSMQVGQRSECENDGHKRAAKSGYMDLIFLEMHTGASVGMVARSDLWSFAVILERG
jgi:hypothetical protein